MNVSRHHSRVCVKPARPTGRSEGPGASGPVSVRSGRRGAALITVLAVTLLMAVLVLSLISMGLAEKRGAASSVAGLDADALAQSVITLVVSQLREGTRQVAVNGTPLPWTSQPGALRVHELDGSLRTLVKLYSAAAMGAGSVAALAEDLPPDWDRRPLGYVDLNEPAMAPELRGAGTIEEATLRFPIVDPRQAGTRVEESVEGFSYGSGTRSIGGVVPPGNDPSEQRLPMPVRWLYRLADGTLGVLDEDGRFTGVAGDGRPTAANRITGRLAFWTDDETCKINVNTASEGVHWDTPRCTTREELALAMKQPAAGEFQRFPGHPAMVSLSSVLFPHSRFHADFSVSAPRTGRGPMNEMSAVVAEGLWSLAPVLNGSSTHTSRGGRSVVPGLALPDPWPVVPDGTARVTSPEDLLWGGEGSGPTEGIRAMAPVFLAHRGAAQRLMRGGFFLTAASSAPELTLFGTPRISVWPIHENVIPGQGLRGTVPRGSAHDYLMALTTTVGSRRYHWQRAAPGDGHFNFFGTDAGKNRALFEYARGLTDRTMPGFHREGMPSSFAEKYGAGPADDRDSILVGIFDYIRQTNFNDAGLTSEQQFCVSCPADPQRGFGQVSPLFAGGTAKTRRTDQLRPADLHAAKGAGRMLTVSEVSFVFTCLAEVGDDGVLRGTPSSEAMARKLDAPGKREVQMAVVVEGFVPSQGWGEYRPYLALGLGGEPSSPTDGIGALPELRLFDHVVGLAPPSAAAPGSPPPRFAFLKTSDDLASRWVPAGGLAGVRFAAADNRLSTVFTFQSVVVSGDREMLEFSGTPEGRPLQLALFDTPDQDANGQVEEEPGSVSTADLVQVVPLVVPPIDESLPCPRIPEDGVPTSWSGRLAQAKNGGRLLSEADVVQSLVPAHGDHRLTAASRTLAVPDSATPAVEGSAVFVAHPGWGRSRQAHRLTEGFPDAHRRVLGPLSNAPATGYIPGVAMLASSAPDFPWQPFQPGRQLHHDARGRLSPVLASEVFESGRLDHGRRGVCFPHLTGDFDNGVAWAPDGPYLNRPDDGETSGFTIGGVPYFDVADPQPMRLPEPRPRVWGAQRQVPSPVMLGSLPTGVKARVPWQTLLFRPHGDDLDPREWRSADGHYGWSWPRDHLWLDLFWMPVQEPAALSSPVATEGKINLNHQIVPFRHIRRTTALHALLKAEKLLAIPDTAGQSYKLPPGSPPQHETFRHFVDAEETIAQWDREVFDKGDVFLTASQICEHHLVPEGQSGDRAAMREFWSRHRLTGDNAKERPFANIYSRLTTRSNTYRVHYRVEVLQPVAPDGNGRTPREGLVVAAMQEGSAVIERRLDPSHPDLPDAVAAVKAGQLPPSLDLYHEWRVRQMNRFLR
jgi:hypothetical protein